MKVEVKVFAAVRELAGVDAIEVQLEPGATIGQLRSCLCDRFPNSAGLLQAASFAVNAEYAGDETAIETGQEVACIPPVSGG